MYFDIYIQKACYQMTYTLKLSQDLHSFIFCFVIKGNHHFLSKLLKVSLYLDLLLIGGSYEEDNS